MTRIAIEKLIWNEWSREHIKKHGVTSEETEVAAKNLIVHKRGYKGRYVVTGRTGTRILSLIVVREKAKNYLVITARDADKKEKRSVYAKEKNRQNT